MLSFSLFYYFLSIMHNFKLAIIPSLFLSLFSVTAHSALRDCGVPYDSGRGTRSLSVNVNISPSDVKNNAHAAWLKIAEAAQNQYGQDVKVGMINLVVYGKVWGVNSLIGSYPIAFEGSQSIQGTVMDFANVPKQGGADPKPCKPIACCEECGANSSFASMGRINKFGFVNHELYAILPRKKVQLTLRKNVTGFNLPA